jgi:hypothetical protein
MATIDLSQASVLCTPSELRVVKTASEQALTGHSTADLKKHIAQARKLRDKWRDLATRQRREVQKTQGSRGTDSAARSKEKANLFGRVLARLEAQLARQAGSSEKPAATGAAGARGPTKRARTQEHRSTRSQVREQLGAKQAELQAAASTPASSSADTKSTTRKKTPKKKVASKPASKKAPAPAVARSNASSAGGEKKKTAKKAVKKTIKKETAKKQSASASGAAVTGVTRKKSGSSPLGSGSQKSAETAAKRGRLKASGLDTRIRGHVSARGKRAQGRRDSRGGR